MSEDIAGQADTLRALIADLERQMAEPMPPAIRQEQERGMGIALLTLRLMEEPAGDHTDAIQDELDAAMRNVPKPLKGSATFSEASRYVLIRRDVEPWEVWVRWDAVPSAMRETVEVLAKLWTDTIKGRPLGRPKKHVN